MRKPLWWWLVVANILFFSVTVAVALVTGDVWAQSLPPVQTINTNAGIPCHASGSHGPVERCQPGWTYGCASSPTGEKILDTDGNRRSIQFQNTGSVPIVLTFGDDAVGNNGFVVQPGIPYLWSNQNGGNSPGGVTTSSVSIISSGASTCVVLFTD